MSLERDALAARFSSVRAATEALAQPLSAEDQQLQSMPDASPTKWHRAHTSWFFEEFLLVPQGRPATNPQYRYLFNSYYDAVGPRHTRARRGMLSRPSADEVGAYRRTVDGRMVELILGADADTLRTLTPLLELGLAHEEQHQELILTDIVHAFSESPLRPAVRALGDRPELETCAGTELSMRELAGGLVSIGNDGLDGFSFDNEGPRHRTFLEPFAIGSRPISVGDVRAFIQDGGYSQPSLWLAEGFEHTRARSLEAPAYARLEGATVIVFGVDGEREAHDDEPACHLSYYEADALARFLGGRLPTEAEWEHAASDAAEAAGNFRESGALRPLPSTAPRGSTGQLFGDVWEWTSSAYAAYPGFRPARGAVGEYNGKFMVNQLVLRGGSGFTPRGHVRSSYRNFWPPHTSFQMSGARVARSLTR